MRVNDVAGAIVGCRLIQETRVQMRVDDVAAPQHVPGLPRYRIARRTPGKRVIENMHSN